jgi:hypothetical protein
LKNVPGAKSGLFQDRMSQRWMISSIIRVIMAFFGKTDSTEGEKAYKVNKH